MPVQFDENYLTKNQKKLAEIVIREVSKFSKLKILSYTIFGLNPLLLVEELQEKARGKSKHEIRLIEKKIKNVKDI